MEFFKEKRDKAMPRRRMRKSRTSLIFDQTQPIYDCVMVDMNTQRDFLDEGCLLPIKDREAVLHRIKMLLDWTKKYRLPMISPVNSHRPRGNDLINSPLFNCIEGTLGQQKIPITLMPKRYLIEHDNSVSLSDNLLEHYMQIVIQKKSSDVFTNPRADRLFTRLQAKRFLIFGVGAERAIKNLGLGLLSRGKNPIIVSDACGSWEDESAHLAIRQLEAKGAIIQTTEEVLALEPDGLPVPHIELVAD